MILGYHLPALLSCGSENLSLFLNIHVSVVPAKSVNISRPLATARDSKSQPSQSLGGRKLLGGQRPGSGPASAGSPPRELGQSSPGEVSASHGESADESVDLCPSEGTNVPALSI